MSERRLRDVECPQCGKPFRLVWNDYTHTVGDAQEVSLRIHDCPSGGVYMVTIECPHCTYTEEL